MTYDDSTSTQAVPFRTVIGTLAAAVLSLVALAITPLGGVLLTDGAQAIFPVLIAAWLGFSLYVDANHWNEYGRVRQYVALLVWSVLGISLLSSLPVLWIAQSGIGESFFRSLVVTWLGLSVVADVRGWSTYSPAQRNVAFVVWLVIGLVAVSTFLGA